MTGKRQHKHTNFHSSLIAIALSNMEDKKASVIGKKTAAFLNIHHNIEGTWNYWHRSSYEFVSTTYPDDLDDTASALAAIRLSNPETLSGDDCARFVKELCKQEIAPGGPYRTWCVENSVDKNIIAEKNKVDIGVNAAIGYALSLYDIELNGLTAYIENAIREDSLCSDYYVDEIIIIYLISRWYRGGYMKVLIKKLYTKLENIPIEKEPLIASMILTSLIRFGESKKDLEPKVFMLAKEISLGPKAYGLYIEKIEKNTKWYSGSSALSAALYAETLSLFKPAERRPFDFQDELYENIMDACYRTLCENILESSDSVSEAINYGLGEECIEDIALLPFRCVSADNPEKDKKMFTQLGTAHLFGCIAYGILDKASDNQGVIPPQYISIALIAHSECVATLTSEAVRSDIDVNIIKNTFRNMGFAAIWESTEASFTLHDRKITIDKIPNYDNGKILERKSLGICVAPIIAFIRKGGNLKDIPLLQNFFGHYCAARHLHDDVHDWNKDLACGRMNSVTAICLNLGITSGRLSLPISYYEGTLSQNISEICTQGGISAIAEKILFHADEGEKILKNISSKKLLNIDFLSAKIGHFRRGAEKSLKEDVLFEEFCIEMENEKISI